MSNTSPDQAAELPGLSSSGRALILQSLIPVAASLTATQIEGFSQRLGEALFKLSDQSIRPEEANISFHSYHNLKKNSSVFYRMVTTRVNEMLTLEVKALEKGKRKKTVLASDEANMSLVTFDEMENKVLLGNMSQALELDNADELVALNLRISQLLQIEEISVHANPFRPDVFLKAVYQAWCDFDPSPESHHLVLRLLRPDVFLQLNPILHELNAALIARGILPQATDLFSVGKHQRQSRSGHAAGADPFFDSKLKGLLYANVDDGQADDGASGAGKRGNSDVNNGAGSGGSGSHDRNGRTGSGNAGGSGGTGRRALAGSADGSTITIDRELFEFLTGLQISTAKLQAQTEFISGNATDAITKTDDMFPQHAALLREVAKNAPQDSLTSVDTNTINLLTNVFDFVFSDPHIPGDIKNLIGQLQIPTLKAALVDREFFFKKNHPARLLIESLAKSSVSWDATKGMSDPLYQMIVKTVNRVQNDFDQKLKLFSEAATELSNFIETEEKLSQEAIAEPIAEAMKQEKIRQARELANNDVASRTDTGEVPGFVEVFLEEQWINILVLAHSVKESKPQALENTLKTMDDLIWSVKPKTNAEECKELVSKLPAMLSSLSAWLNTIKWEDPSRLLFFSKLAERHAAIARAPMEMSPRQQLEIAVNVAQKASERRFTRNPHDHTFTDRYIQMLDQIQHGNWFDFTRNNGSIVRFKLAWISPRRSRFIFTNRQGHDAFSISTEELLDIFRSEKVHMISTGPVIDRALHAMLDKRESVDKG